MPRRTNRKVENRGIAGWINARRPSPALAMQEPVQKDYFGDFVRNVKFFWNYPRYRGLSAERRNKFSCIGRQQQEVEMGLGRGALLWLIGVPLPVIILIALFWHH
jgi:hypothetical protein